MYGLWIGRIFIFLKYLYLTQNYRIFLKKSFTLCNADQLQTEADPFQIDADPFQIDADPFQIDADPFQIDADPFPIDAGRILKWKIMRTRV